MFVDFTKVGCSANKLAISLSDGVTPRLLTRPLYICCVPLQALTTSVAFWYGLEAFKLRAEVVQEEVRGSSVTDVPLISVSLAPGLA
jgi:hypothetical protein